MGSSFTPPGLQFIFAWDLVAVHIIQLSVKSGYLQGESLLIPD